MPREMILRAQVEREVGRLTDAQWDFLFHNVWCGTVPTEPEQLSAFIDMASGYCGFCRLGKTPRSKSTDSTWKANPSPPREILRCARAVARALSLEEETVRREYIDVWLVRTDDGRFDWILTVDERGKVTKRPDRFVAWTCVEVPVSRRLTAAEVLADWMTYILIDSRRLRRRLAQLEEPARECADRQELEGGSEQ
jgi:hypothetical protein